MPAVYANAAPLPMIQRGGGTMYDLDAREWLQGQSEHRQLLKQIGLLFDEWMLGHVVHQVCVGNKPRNESRVAWSRPLETCLRRLLYNDDCLQKL